MKSIISIITHITGKKRALEQIHSTRFCAEGGPIMNVHTFELSTVVDYKIYLELAKLSYPDKRNEHRRICDRLTAYGLWITLYKSKKQYKFWETYHVYYRINPHRLFEQGDYLGLHRANELISTISEINHKLAEVSEYFPQIELCKLVRCDFCVNATAPSKELVEDIIGIANRSFASVISTSKRRITTVKQTGTHYLSMKLRSVRVTAPVKKLWKFRSTTRHGSFSSLKRPKPSIQIYSAAKCAAFVHT